MEGGVLNDGVIAALVLGTEEPLVYLGVLGTLGHVGVFGGRAVGMLLGDGQEAVGIAAVGLPVSLESVDLGLGGLPVVLSFGLGILALNGVSLDQQIVEVGGIILVQTAVVVADHIDGGDILLAGGIGAGLVYDADLAGGAGAVGQPLTEGVVAQRGAGQTAHIAGTHLADGSGDLLVGAGLHDRLELLGLALQFSLSGGQLVGIIVQGIALLVILSRKAQIDDISLVVKVVEGEGVFLIVGVHLFVRDLVVVRDIVAVLLSQDLVSDCGLIGGEGHIPAVGIVQIGTGRDTALGGNVLDRLDGAVHRGLALVGELIAVGLGLGAEECDLPHLALGAVQQEVVPGLALGKLLLLQADTGVQTVVDAIGSVAVVLAVKIVVGIRNGEAVIIHLVGGGVALNKTGVPDQQGSHQNGHYNGHDGIDAGLLPVLTFVQDLLAAAHRQGAQILLRGGYILFLIHVQLPPITSAEKGIPQTDRLNIRYYIRYEGKMQE